MNSDTYTNVLYDLGVLLKERTEQAKHSSLASKPAFDQGQLLAFYQVISLVQQQARAFGIPLAEIGLADIDPDKDVLGQA